MQILVDILPLDPDPGIQNFADPTDLDPDPKHCFKREEFFATDIFYN